MEWKGLSFSIDRKKILKEVTGVVEPGRLTGVIGPSGSGKTTLLNVLAGRQNVHARHIELLGRITAAGRSVDPSVFRSRIAYVMQEDRLLPFETPRECFEFSAYLRLPRDVLADQRKEFVERLLSTLHLHSCAETVVGSILVKGISGGEKKRTSVGVELITNPKILFLDEPLSGLDSYAAYTLMEALMELAREGVTVLCTVHQPSSEIFAMMDDVVVLHMGEVVYHGPTRVMSAHFSILGFPCPAAFNPADHVMFLLQSESEDRIREIKENWLRSNSYQELVKKVDRCEGLWQVSIGSSTSSQALAVSFPKRGFGGQLRALTAREIRGTIRNKGILVARLGMSVLLSALYGWLFAGSASSGDDAYSSGRNCVADRFDAGACTADFQAHFGTLVSLSILSMMGSAQPILLVFPSERPVFLREYAAHQYGVVPYFISKTLVEMPVVLVAQMLSLSITYWSMGLHGDLVLLVVVFWGLGIASSSLALLLGCSVVSGEKAMQLAPLAMVPQMLFSGLFLPVSKIPISLRWVQILCPLKYAIDLLTLVEFNYVRDRISTCEGYFSVEQCHQLHPGDYLRDTLIENQSIKWDQWAFYVSMLASLTVGFRIGATILLWRKGKYVF